MLRETESPMCRFHRRVSCPLGLPWWLSSVEATCNAVEAGDKGSILASGRSSGSMHGNLLQYSCLENPMDKGAWWVIVHGVAESGMIESTEPIHTQMHYFFKLFY